MFDTVCLVAEWAANLMIRLLCRRSISILAVVLVAVPPGIFAQAKAHTTDQSAPQPRADQHVVIISIDGMLPDYAIKPNMLGLKVPVLTSLRLGGAYAAGMYGVYPSGDYPSHATIATGVNPLYHGILNDTVFDPSGVVRPAPEYSYASALESEPIWTAAKRSGLTTASVGWPTTAGAGIDYNVPEVWGPNQDPMTGPQSAPYITPGLLDKAAGSGSAAKGDELRTRITEFIIKTYKPNLLLVRMTELDKAHHQFGPRSREAVQTMEFEDAYLGRIVQSAKDAAIYD
jgi:predicted AlkP superfamily pyrophosphatase or phosphodiesterase